MRLLQIALVRTLIVLTTLALGVAASGLITSATAIYSIDLNQAGDSFINEINQSGLSTGYTSGVDDFATYLGSNPTHTDQLGTSWGSSIKTGNLDFDLGSTLTVANIALWNFSIVAANAATNIQIFSSNLSDFSVSNDLGNFSRNVPAHPGTAEILNFAATDAQFFRFNILQHNGGSYVG